MDAEARATRKIRLLEITNFYRQKDGHKQRKAGSVLGRRKEYVVWELMK